MIQEDSKTSPLSSSLLEWINLSLVLLGLLLVLLKQDFAWFWAFFCGGLLSVLNLRLWRLLVAGLTGQRKFSKALLALLALLKLTLIFGGLALILWFLKPPLVPFLLGISTLVMAIVLQGVWGMIKG
ncbi:MAG: ATP synthase subunit I [Deltaproteobacteria bacterium]|nr:ATP synthase subunit I [Deltaproteobacteria bacterium]